MTLTGAGSVTLKASQAADSNYIAGSTNATFTVGKPVLTVTAASQSIAFGGTRSPYTATLTGFVGADTSSVVTGTASLTTSPATPTAVGTYPVTAAIGTLAAANYSFNFVNGSVTIGVGTPTINFAVLNQTYGAAPFAVSATSNSTGTITFSVVSGPATISGATVTLTGAGSVTLKASQAADSNYIAGSTNAIFTVGKPVLTVTAASQSIAFGGTLAPYTATITGFVGADTSSVVTGTASLTTSPATPTAVGTYPVTAAIGTLAAANYSFNFVNGSVTIGLGTPTINFAVLNQTYGAAPFPVAATSNSTGAITYSVVSGPATISGSTVTLTGAGSVTLKASQAADSNYIAGSTNAIFTVGKPVLTVTAASQSIAFGGTLAPYTATITGFVGADTSSVVTGTASLTTSPATPTAVGTYPVTAAIGTLAAANYSFNFVNGSVTIGLGTPTINFAVLNQTYGAAPFPVAATSNSTGAITYSVVSGPATISGSTVTLTGAGSVTLKASQAADSNYIAGSTTAIFTVGAGTPAINFAVGNQTYGAAPFGVSATSNSTGAITYSVVSGPATISGATVTLTGAGSVTLKASQAADSNYVAVSTNADETVGAGTPTINFAVLNQTYGAAPFGVSATSNSTGAITYSVVSGPATISGSTVTLKGAGSVTLKASQAADSNYIAGSTYAIFTVGAGTPTISFTVSNQTYGAAPFAVAATSNSTGAFTYSVVSGPATISGSTVTLTGAGSVTLKASQAADSNYIAGSTNAIFTVGAGTPTITFTVGNQTLRGSSVRGECDFELSTGAITYSVVSGPATHLGLRP